jgi:hypothetical protein
MRDRRRAAASTCVGKQQCSEPLAVTEARVEQQAVVALERRLLVAVYLYKP